jgi:allophanate hydrolase
MEQNPEAVLPVIRAVLAKAPAVDGVQTFRAQYRLQALKALCDKALGDLDCVLTPTIGRPVTLAQLAAEPVLRNSELGYYTNFMNLLDYAAVAVPSGFMNNGLPWGVTLFGRAFTDQYLLSVANALQRRQGSTSPAPTHPARNDRARLVVCGAHLDGLALNWQLKQRGGRLVETTQSSPHYQLHALAGDPPFRPGMVRVAEGGVAITVEVWELPSSELGSFLTGIAAPLGLGKVQLADGRWESGFICEPYGLEGATDISHLGGWRAYLQSRG